MLRWLKISLCWAAVITAGCGSSGGPKVYTTFECLADPACPHPLVSAHRGSCGNEPENTLAAYLDCEAKGVTMVEIDPRQTADGVWVIMHDSDVIRTTNGETLFPDRVEVDQLTAAEFATLVIDDERCAENPNANPERCRPPTLQEVLDRTGPQLLIDMDFKAGDPASAAALIDAAGAGERVLFFDSNLESLRAYRGVIGDGLVMPRAQDAASTAQLVEQVGEELELRWIHVDPAYLADARTAAFPAGVRLYLNAWDYNVDTWLYAAELTPDEEQKQEFLTKAWQLLDELIENGARGLGTDRGAQLSDYLYPDGFGF